MKLFSRVLVMLLVIVACVSGSAYASANPPTFTPSLPSGSVVEPGDTVTFVIEVEGDNTIASCDYSWNGGKTKSIFDTLKGEEYLNRKITFEFAEFSDNFGKNVLKICAEDENGVSTGIKEYIYIVEDNEAPTITSDVKNNAVVKAGSSVTITLEDNYELKEVEYSWNGGEKKYPLPTDDIYKKLEYTMASFPNVNDVFVLKISAEDLAGNVTTKTFTYNVEYDDDTAPVISMSEKDGSVVAGGTRITMTILDEESKITTLKYNWQGSAERDLIPSEKEPANKCVVKLPAIGTQPGTYIINVTAINSVGKQTKGTYRYIVEAEPTIDNEAPTIQANPSAGDVEPKSPINLNAKDNEELKTLIYNWDNEPDKEVPMSGKEKRVDVYTPSKPGKHILYVTVIDAAGNSIEKAFQYVVLDDKAPEVTASPNSGEIETLAKIKVSATDDTELKTITYNWDNGTDTTLNISGTEDSVIVVAPSKSGKHILYVTVTDAAKNTVTEKYTYTIIETDKPTIGANPASGKIAPESTIKLTAKDNEELKELTYNWDKGTDVLRTITGKEDIVNVIAPSQKGTHTLYVLVKDANNNSVSEQFDYIINDEEAPTLIVNPNGGNVNAGEPVKITGKDNEELESITYNWDTESPKEKPVSGKEATIDTEVPAETGKHTLYVTVKDKDGNKVTDSIEFIVADDEAPTITMNPKDKSEVKGGKIVKATLKDDVELKEVEYKWEHDDEEKVTLSGTSKTISLSALPYKEGTYKVTITVIDTSGNKTTNKYTYYVVDEDEDEEYPTVDADPDGGELEYGDKIVVTAEDEDGEIEYVEYYWDDDKDDTTKKYKDEFTVKVPSDEGKHSLYVRAMDDDDNLCDYEKFTYKIVENKYPGNSDIIGDINNRVRALRVEIRNADDKIRFEPDEEILYYVDYYNGTSSDVKNAKLVVDLPTYLEAEEASDNGKVTTKQVTWNLGTLEAGEYGRVSFVAKYTSSKVNEKIITVPAKIYSGTTLKDTSTVRNMIFCEGASGTGNHQAYCVGYPDGTFLAEGRITRAELASMICNIEGITSIHRGQFTDANNHWAANYMQAVVDRGYMIPKSYNYFGAQDYATRADLAYAIAAILDVEDLEPIFISATDTKNSDVRCAMEQLLRLGIMDGYSDGTAKPNSNITRAEAVTIFNNYLFRGELYTKGYNYAYNFENNYNHGGNYYILRFTDLSSNHWAYGHIMEATNNHRYERVMDGNEEML